MNQRYTALLFCSIIWFTHIFSSNALSILLPLVTKEFSLSYSETGVLVTASLLVFAFMQLPAGYFAGRIDNRKILVFGLAFHSISNLLIGATANYAQFFGLNMLRSIGSGCHLTVATAFISNLFETKDRGGAIGTHESAVSLGGLISPVVTLPLALILDWRTTYLIYGVIGLAVAAASYVFMRNIEEPEIAHAPVGKEEKGATSANVLMLLLVLTIHAFVFHAISAFLPLFLSTDKEIVLAYLGYYVAIPNVLGLFGRPIGGYLSDKIGRRSMTLISLASLASGIILTVLVRETYWLILCLAVLGFGLHTVIPVLFAFLMDQFAPSKRALMAGRINAVRHLISGSSPTVVGTIADSAGFSVAFLALAMAVISNFFISLKMRE